MGDIKGFLKVKRDTVDYRPVCQRVNDFCEVCLLPKEEKSKAQASRCMDCGTPFCNWACPLGNYIPEWNDFMFKGNWDKALELLSATNNLPEVTGRICPALCEYSCVLGINDEAVSIKDNELAIIEYGFKHNLIKPRPPERRTGKKVAIVGSGPAGISCADQLNKAGHSVVVFEKDDAVGGILRYGIPDFKLEKTVLQRRLNIMEKEGIEFITSVNVGFDITMGKLKKEFDAICLTGGSRVPRDLNISGRELGGIHFAMDYLVQSNKRVGKQKIGPEKLIDAKGKKVVVIGGGDTGADCVGVAHRQGASCIVQIELLPKPAELRTKDFPWPKYPVILKTSTSHDEGGERQWSILTKCFVGEGGRVKKLLCAKVNVARDSSGAIKTEEILGTDFEIDADLVILALGFLYPEKKGIIEELGLELDQRGNVKTGANFMTSAKGIFCAGDMHRGQSLIVWAISEARQAAYNIDRYLVSG